MSSRPRRSSISIYDYPEDLNPFKDDTTNSQPQTHQESKPLKEPKHKFWTFGRSRKKRSNSFSIKSTWSGLFGKRKETPESSEKKSTITTVSTTYRREPFDRPTAPLRLSKDQQEFDEALGTLTRRRKYTLDNNSPRYNSSTTMNGDPARIYDGSPQDTTMSIMGEHTPKPPARRFGQVSPRSTDKIPSLDFEDKQPKQNGDINPCDKTEETPVPPLRRFGNRSSQRSNGGILDFEEANRSDDVNLRDENENVPEDYVFKRCSQDAVRKSNLSINSCASVTSTASTYGRKKRRAPQPPKRKEQLETPLEANGQTSTEANKVVLQITEPIDITRVTENIDGMVNNSELDENRQVNENVIREDQKQSGLLSKINENVLSDNIANNETCEISKNCATKIVKEIKVSEEITFPEKDLDERSETTSESETKIKPKSSEPIVEKLAEKEDAVNVEYKRMSQEKIEIIKDIDDEEVCLRKDGSSSTLSRSDSFSVKEEIEKIEKQIKALESKNASKERESFNEYVHHDNTLTSPRLSIQTNRRHFFEDMVTNGQSDVKIEFGELPREQKDIHVVRLTDASVPTAAPREPVKVIELHISEPIKHRPELLDEVNPIPKPRRHNSLSLKDTSESSHSRAESESPEESDKKEKSF